MLGDKLTNCSFHY